jgi:anaerobic magnesium-protoporphyrin IX monomethyl ester cyclase
MKILFVFPFSDIVTAQRPLAMQEQMQFGISYISAVLKAHGHQTRLIVLSRVIGKENDSRLAWAFRIFSPDVVCFTAVATEFGFVAQMARIAKFLRPEAKLLVGGPHVSLVPEDAAGHPFDAICIGEGEYPTLEYVDALAGGNTPTGIRNLWLRLPEGWEKNPPRPFLEDLDSLPFPDRDIWQEWILPGRTDNFVVLLGRGCPFPCTYCSNHALKKLASGKYVRFRSVDHVLRECEELAHRYPEIQKIYFEVETIGTNRGWALEFCDGLARWNSGRERPLGFGVNLRVTPNHDPEELFAAFQRANFLFINVGVESGSERVRRDILKRNYSNNDIVKTVRSARRHGLKVSFFNLIGLPGETEADFRETIEINRICQPDWHFLSIFYPYPGTELYQCCLDMGLRVESGAEALERRRATLDLPTFSRRRIMHYYFWFEYHVRKGRKSSVLMMLRVLAAWLMSHEALGRFYQAVCNNRLLRPLSKALQGRI